MVFLSHKVLMVLVHRFLSQKLDFSFKKNVFPILFNTCRTAYHGFVDFFCIIMIKI